MICISWRMELCVEKKVTRKSILALASVSGGNTLLAIVKGIASCYSPQMGFDWGTAIALGAIGVLLGGSVFLTVRGDLGYLVDAFT